MMVEISKEVTTWKDIIKFLLSNLDSAKRGHNGYYFSDIKINRVCLGEDPFTTCCYTNKRGKLSTLRKQYLNEDSLKQINSSDVVEVSMVGGPKWGSTAGNKHCMKSLTVDHTNKTVIINFRNSDFFKKFLVDLYFVKNILNEVGISDYTYSCHFENLTLRTPFVYLYLNQLDEGEIRDLLSSNNLLIDEFIKYLRSVNNKVISYKSLERALRYFKKLPIYPVVEEYL